MIGGTITVPTLDGDRELKLSAGVQQGHSERLKGMDAQGIDMEVLSINPFWYRKERDLAAEIVRVQNEKLAELCAAHPDRFAAFASMLRRDMVTSQRISLTVFPT